MTSDLLTVVDETSERSDLARRAEVKYAFTAVDVGKLRSHLDGNCRRIVHNDPVSAVRSIYFDDVRLSSCQDNLDGAGSRRKLRLRWYDSLRPQHEAFIEIKWREGRVTGKHRLHLHASRPLENLSYTQLFQLLDTRLPEHFRCALVRFPEPAIIVEYQREHFVSPDGALRMTLDYDLTYYDQFARQFIATDFPSRLDDLVVIEGKVPVGREADLRRLLHPFVPRANRCSKYVHGLRLTGHIPASD